MAPEAMATSLYTFPKPQSTCAHGQALETVPTSGSICFTTQSSKMPGDVCIEGYRAKSHGHLKHASAWQDDSAQYAVVSKKCQSRPS